MKKVIVTGASGFIGKHTLKTLGQKGFEVHAVYSQVQPQINAMVKWYQANLLDTNQIKELFSKIKANYLLHFAWYAVPGKYWQAEENFLWVQSSLELLREFYQQGGQRVVMAGTCAEYDWRYGYCSEFITPRQPNTAYGICKQALQEMVKYYSDINQLSSAWGSIFFPYGTYEHPNRLVPSVIVSLLKGEVAKCSHGNQIRDFIYVQDAADAFVALLESDVMGVVNIGSGKPIAIKDVVYKIAHKFGRADLIKLGAIASNPREPALLVADVSRLSNEVGWRSQFDLDKGLDQTIAWWKKYQSGMK
ncbi:NAD(P)-dependent oxidoreductase [Okeania sp. SIO1I7]|uniref:NAD-dependent epimerase/dehydratase family protein n=1 Tax=Okeania sp. SIO1I7 TaxID=2607772 RepID=UPI0013FCD666|nr:NAD(P)-dependent oxidoreductase [Okeania sp. SIO1I7]NET24738.1 NAD(P)-dependent oxidoreductase [Okeania sp. SIO1I7]